MPLVASQRTAVSPSFSAVFSMTLLNLPPIANNGSLRRSQGRRGAVTSASTGDCVTPSYTTPVSSPHEGYGDAAQQRHWRAYSYVAATGNRARTHSRSASAMALSVQSATEPSQ